MLFPPSSHNLSSICLSSVALCLVVLAGTVVSVCSFDTRMGGCTITVQYVYIVTRGSELMFIGVIHLIFSRSRHTTLAFYSFESICR